MNYLSRSIKCLIIFNAAASALAWNLVFVSNDNVMETSVLILLSDQINLLKINEIVDKRGVVLGLRTTFLMAKKWF